MDHMYFAIWFFFVALSGNDVLNVIHRMLPTDSDCMHMLFVIIKISLFLICETSSDLSSSHNKL